MKVPALEPDAVHVWHLRLDLDSDLITAAAEILDSEEQLTAAYFRQPRHRDRFVAGRSQLRQLLSAYTGTPSTELRFKCSAHGKPSLVQAAEEDELFFNFTHSADRAVFAITRIGPVGVDLERVQAWNDLRELEQLVFTSAELELLETLAEDERDREFFRRWTHKEALVKATGDGLSLAPDTFSVDLAQACLFPGELADHGWRFQDVSQSTEWPAAIAVASHQFSVQQFA